MNPHDWFAERAVEYATRTLDAEEATAFETHLGQCDACRTRGRGDRARPRVAADGPASGHAEAGISRADRRRRSGQAASDSPRELGAADRARGLTPPRGGRLVPGWRTLPRPRSASSRPNGPRWRHSRTRSRSCGKRAASSRRPSRTAAPAAACSSSRTRSPTAGTW